MQSSTEITTPSFIDQIKNVSLAILWITTMALQILETNAQQTGIKLPIIVKYIILVIQNVAFIIVFNAKKIENFVLHPDDKKILEDIKQTQDLINDNLTQITTARTLQSTEPIRHDVSVMDSNYIHIPRQYLIDQRGKTVQIGECAVYIDETAR